MKISEFTGWFIPIHFLTVENHFTKDKIWNCYYYLYMICFLHKTFLTDAEHAIVIIFLLYTNNYKLTNLINYVYSVCLVTWHSLWLAQTFVTLYIHLFKTSLKIHINLYVHFASLIPKISHNFFFLATKACLWKLHITNKTFCHNNSFEVGLYQQEVVEI